MRDDPLVDQLISVIQELSLARDLATVTRIVREAARALTGADGATFVLRDGDMCFYVDEDAITPLWKGSRFPMSACISGWAMLNKQSVIIEDIYTDDRVPLDAYRPTFVKSLAMVPIRSRAPLGAIGNYWASAHRATEHEVKLLQALADSASIAMENVSLYADLEARVRERTAELERANRDLESFSYAVSHDLKAPVRAMAGFAAMTLEDAGPALDADARANLERIGGAARRMNELIDGLLRVAHIRRNQLERGDVDVTSLARTIVAELRSENPDRAVDVRIGDGLKAKADSALLRVALVNLLGNAWKFTARTSPARIELEQRDDGAFVVRDNGAGFDPNHAKDKLFVPFQRFHAASTFPGHGIGLATVQRIVDRHGGRIWAESAPGQGAAFFFTLNA